MYTSNLPDGVVIPDDLVELVETMLLEARRLTEQNRSDIAIWVRKTTKGSTFIKGYWRKQVQENIVLCKTYGIPEGAELFSYVCTLIEETW